MRALAVLTVRNEAAFLLEWLAHHRTVGFTDFLIFSNDCEDGTDAMLDRLQQMGQIVHVRNTKTDDGAIQWEALKQADKHPVLKEVDWILPLDVDEFVNIHVGGHRLADLFAAVPQASSIALTWRLFGNNGVVEFQDRPVLQQFTKAAPVPCYWPWKSAMFKTLYRNDGTYGKIGIHRPRQPDRTKLAAARWFDGSGRELPDVYKTQKIFSNFWQENNALVQLNHYSLGAKQTYILKRNRGRAVHSSHLLGMDYWVDRNFNVDEDTSVLALWPDVARALDRLKDDAEIRMLHQTGCDWRRSKFDALMLEDDYRQLFGRLMMCADTQPLSRQQADIIMQFGRRAQNKKP